MQKLKLFDETISAHDFKYYAVKYAELAKEKNQTISFYKNEFIEGEMTAKQLIIDPGKEYSFSWVFYASGKVKVYFRFLGGTKKDPFKDMYNDVTNCVLSWKEYIHQTKKSDKKLAVAS